MPAGWTKETELPKSQTCQNIWQGLEDPSLQSSEAEKPRPAKEGAKSSIVHDMSLLRKSLGAVSEDDDESDDSYEDAAEVLPPRSGSGMLAPGSKGLVPTKKRIELQKKKKEVDPSAALLSTMEQGLASGQNMSELMPVMMMQMMLQNQQSQKDHSRSKHKSSRSSRSSASTDHGGSSSESSSGSGSSAGRGKGMKAVVTLHRLHRRIKRRPSKIYKKFEKDITRELGIVPGQPWTLRQWLAKQPWGKFRGIHRCAIQDAIAYEFVRNGQYEVAAAQLAQNMKSKIQSVLQGGDWSAAWLLTGIADPLTKKEWGGTQEEMAVVSEYVNALARLKKKVKEAKDAGQENEAEA